MYMHKICIKPGYGEEKRRTLAGVFPKLDEKNGNEKATRAMMVTTKQASHKTTTHWNECGIFLVNKSENH